jgi:hypothetical protein
MHCVSLLAGGVCVQELINESPFTCNFTGAPQAFEGIMSGVTFGLPRISTDLAREMASTYVAYASPMQITGLKPNQHPAALCLRSFGTPSWNIPFNPPDAGKNVWPIDNLITLTANAEWAKTKEQREAEIVRQQEEALLNAANAEFELSNETNDEEKADALLKRQQQLKRRAQRNGKLKSFPWTQNYNASQILDALNDIAPVDSKVNNTVNIINKYYLSDPIMEAYTPWERPPIKKVICAYGTCFLSTLCATTANSPCVCLQGINMRTEVGYHYTTDMLREQWRIEDITFEDKGRIYSQLTGETYSTIDSPSGALILCY